ncbi:hypothetical protein [Terracoccus sp. 273MFTsu3.1]|uniref:CdiA C-terminal domain-containing protein n=1 Tax=Terracoccus sp. 273MFTsu3.1 TaxID=1172188 RepID=UPI00036E70FF|nr:hypothetical protein [Terracoccus sp. 273MFTsu3.1]
MSHVHDGGHASAAIPGDVALPLPVGDATGLRAAARSLDRAASRARATATVQGTLGPRLSAVWTGDAAAAACSEAAELGTRARRVVDALPAASRSLVTYAGALDGAVARVRSLQREWDALDAEHALTLLRVAALPDPTGAIGVLGTERARTEQAEGRVRLSRTYAGVLDDLHAAARRCARLVAGTTDATFPSAASAGAGRVRAAVTGGLWFADGAVAARVSRDAALADGLLARRVLAGGGASGRLGFPDVAELAAHVRARVDDPVYAQALLSEIGTDGLARLLLAAGVTRGASGAHVDTVRALLGALGSLVITATSHGAPAGTDPRTRTELGSGAALLTDDLVADVATVHVDPVGGGRATGAWLLGQLLSGARASGDDRRLPARFARRAAAAAATAEVAETRDADAVLAHGTTLHADAGATFASWFDDGSSTGDPVHVLLGHVVHDPAEESALLAEPLPDSEVAAGAVTNSRGDRITLGEYLVRRWVVHEANGIESHPELRLTTDTDLAQLLASVATSTGAGAADTRARVMLEVSRTSGHAMLEASTTGIYNRATAPIEPLVADWLSAMRENVDIALATPLLSADTPARYVRQTSGGAEPWLDAEELTGVVAALAVDTGMGLRARDPGAAYGRLVDRELGAAQDSVGRGGDVRRDVVRLGFLDQAASAELVAVARRQDVLNRSAWQGLAEAGHVIDEIRRGSVAGLASTVRTYVDGGTMRSADDDLVIALVRSDVELSQTDLDDARRAELVNRIGAIAAGRTDVLAAIRLGATRAPLLPTVDELRAARDAEIRAAFDAVVKDGSRGRAISALDRLKQRTGPSHRVHVTSHASDPANGSPRVGSIDLSRVKKVEAHEMRTAERLAALGHDITFLPPNHRDKSADGLVDGVAWEFKAPEGSSRDTVVRNLRKGSMQSPRVIVDLQRSPLSTSEALRQAEQALARYPRLESILILDQAGIAHERKRQG